MTTREGRALTEETLTANPRSDQPLCLNSARPSMN